MNSTIVLNRSTVNFISSVQAPSFGLAPASPLLPKVDVLDLIIRALIWLLAIAISLKGQTACCNNPKIKPQEQGYSWCLNCGTVFDDRGHQRPYSQATFYADIDRSLRAGYNLNWMRQES